MPLTLLVQVGKEVRYPLGEPSVGYQDLRDNIASAVRAMRRVGTVSAVRRSHNRGLSGMRGLRIGKVKFTDIHYTADCKPDASTRPVWE